MILPSYEASYAFPHTKLTPFPKDKRPHLMNVITLHNECFNNLASIHITGEEYPFAASQICRANTTDFQDRAPPGAAPMAAPANPGILTIAAGTSQVQQTSLRDEHTRTMVNFKEVEKLKVQIKNLIIEAANQYLPSHPLTGYTQYSMVDLITILYNKFPDIPDSVLAENEASLLEPFNIQTGIEHIWNRCIKAQFLAATVDPISDQKLMRNTLTVLEIQGSSPMQFSSGMKNPQCRKIGNHSRPTSMQSMPC